MTPGLVGQTIEPAAGHPRMRAVGTGAKARLAICGQIPSCLWAGWHVESLLGPLNGRARRLIKRMLGVGQVHARATQQVQDGRTHLPDDHGNRQVTILLKRGHGVQCGLQRQPLRRPARLACHDFTTQGTYRLGESPDPGHQALGRGPLGCQQHYGRPGQNPGVADGVVHLPGGAGIGLKLSQRPASERGEAGDLVADRERLLEAAHQRVDRTRLLQACLAR
jgi:hypothetical protein